MKYIVSAILLTLFAGSAIAGSPMQIVQSFRAAGLEAESPAVMKPKDYGFAPYVCKGVRFFLPSLDEDDDSGASGRAFVCPDSRSRDAIAGYYQKLGERSAAFFSWVFIRGLNVVQINGDMDEDEARLYEAAIPK